MAVTDLGRVCPVPRGVYDNATEYYKLNIVTYVGSSYMAKSTTTGNLPTNTTYWILLSAGSAAGLMEVVYPVGIIIELAVSTNPATLFGMGTWVAHGTGRVTVGIDSGDTDFDTVNETGGAKTHTHALSNGFAKLSNAGKADMSTSVSSYTTNYFEADFAPTSSSSTATSGIRLGGSTAGDSSLQPYIVVYRWRRTA